jgi:serine/threonine protein kinase
VLIDATPAARLADFGQAYVTFATAGYSRSAFLNGTLPWTAPELIPDLLTGMPRGRPSVPGDVYALACVVWEVRVLRRCIATG